MANLSRKFRRSGQRKPPNTRPQVRRLPAKFEEKMSRLAVLGGFANHVSMNLAGLPTTKNGELASMVFAKSCAHARSIGAIAIESPMFDHHAIMSLARMILEASTMIAYLLDPVDEEQQRFRYTVLKLHDTVNRLKLLRGFGAEADDLRRGRDELKLEIVSSSAFSELAEDRKKRVLSGEEIYVIGMRAVSKKIMGWNEENFSSVYAYLSAHAHSSPMSYMRMREHEIDYYFPSEAQYDILSLSMEVAEACLRRSMLRMIDCHPERIDDYNIHLLKDAREDDGRCPFFMT